jgi:predicted acylesterase/phospholipase RssA
MPYWFVEGPSAVEWKRFHSTAILDKIHQAHTIASCSVPFFLPPVKIGKYYYLDGGVNIERPFSAAISMGTTHLFNISTKQSPPASSQPEYHKNFRPKFSTLLRFMLNSFSRDYSFSESAQIEVLNRFSQKIRRQWIPSRAKTAVNAVFHEKNPSLNFNPVKIYLMKPSRPLETLYRDLKSEKNIERSHAEKIFLFHRDVIKRYIDFGYDDAKDKHCELKEFFKESRRDRGA